MISAPVKKFHEEVLGSEAPTLQALQNSAAPLGWRLSAARQKLLLGDPLKEQTAYEKALAEDPGTMTVVVEEQSKASRQGREENHLRRD